MFYGRAAGDYGKGGTPPKRNDRYEQMTKQQELIEQKKREIRLKLEAEKQRKEMELLMKKAGASNKSTVVGRGVSSSSSSSTNKQSSPSSSTPQDDENSGKKTVDVEVKKPSVVPNAFANDGSFLEQFRKMQEEQQRKKAEEEAKKAAASPKIKEEQEPEDSNISEYGGGTIAATVKIPPKPTIKILNAPVRSSSPADSNNSNSSQVSSSGSRNSMSYVPPPNIYNQSNQNQFAPPAQSPTPPPHQQISTAPIKIESSASEYGSHSQDRDRYYPRDSRGDHQNQNQNVGSAPPPPPPPPPPAQGHPQHAGGFPSQVVRQLAQQVAEFGDHIEEMARVENESDPLMWFLYRPDSAEYARYRGLVGQYQREGNSNSHQNNFRDAGPIPSSEYGGSGGMSMEAAQSSSKRRNNNSSSSDEDNEYGGGMSERERRRNRKRRSRWGDRAESEQNSPPSPPPGTFDLGGPRGGGAPQSQSPPPPSGGPGPGAGSFNNDHNHPGVHNFRQNNQHPPHALSGGFSNANNTPLGPPPPGYNMNNPNNQPLGPPGVSDYNPPGPQLPVQRMLLPQGIRPPHPGMMGMGGPPHIGMGRGGVPPPPGMGGNFPQSHNQFMMGGPPRPPPPPMPPGMQIPPSQQQPWGSMGFKEDMSAYGNTNEMQGSSSSLTGGGGDIKPLVPPTTLGTFPLLQNFNPDSKEPPALQKVTRHNPQLLAYAQQAYGNTNLDEEQWKQCEEAYKMNLVFQDIARKKAKDKKLEAEGKFKHEYDSDEEIDGGTWEHKQRMKEMDKTRDWATDLTSKAKGKHHIGDFLPPAELAKFMEKYKAVKEGRELDSSDYQEFKIAESNVGFKMLQKMGWTDGQGLGTTGQGIVAPIEKGNAVSDKQGLGQEKPDDLTEEDDEYTAYRKRMMLAYRFRPNPLNNPRRAYY